MSRPRSTDSVFRAIADPTRRRMLDFLDKGDRTVGDLVAPLRVRKSTASFHLAALIGAGLVRQRRRGRSLMCSLDRRSLHEAQAWLGKYRA
jgi:DNA-binding transcriptional ArsR family regulator